MIARLTIVMILVLSIAGAPTVIFSDPNTDLDPDKILEEDSDRDGLCNKCEREIFGTDPDLADTDGNGISDKKEDHDVDGISNIEELKELVALMDALEKGDVMKVKELIEYSPYIPIIHLWSKLAIHVATENGHTEVVMILLEAGIDVNVQSPKFGWTPLIVASQYGEIEVAKLLIQEEADLNIQDVYGWTALMYASHGPNEDKTEVVRILIKEGADVNVLTQYGWTALMVAAKTGLTEAVRYLLQAGAEMNYENNQKETALSLAERWDHTDIVNMLREAGAN